MLLDSNIVIYALEPEYKQVRRFIAQQQAAVSAICKVEVLGYHKLTPINRQKLEMIFRILPVLPVSSDIIELATSLRQKRKMSLGDALIAGTALSHNLTLATANTDDFEWIENLTVVNPSKLKDEFPAF